MSDLDPRATAPSSEPGSELRIPRTVPPHETAHETRRRVLSEVAEALSATDELVALFDGVAVAILRGLGDHVLVERVVPGRPPHRTVRCADRARATPSEEDGAWRITTEHEEELARCARIAATIGELVHEEGLCSRVALPLYDEAGVAGAIALGRSSHAGGFDAEDVAVVREIARRTGLAMRGARLAGGTGRSEHAGPVDADALARVVGRRDALVAMVAHELRGPLASIAAAIEVLDRLASEEPTIERAREVVRRQLAIATRLTDDLLDTSLLAQGKMVLRVEAIDLGALVADVVEDQRRVAAKHGLALEVEGTDVPVLVRGDRTRLAQALGNVLHNAIKFSDAGGRIRVTLASDGTRATVRVRDQGIGIPAELLGRVFEPFEQGALDHERSGGSLGLGLALVRGVLELHGGRASAWSEGRGRGTELRLELPVAADAPMRVRETPAPYEARHEAVRVLIVEDDRDAAEMLQLLLEREGHSVETASSGEEALALAERSMPDLVLCDLDLRGVLGGLDVAHGLRRIAGLAATCLVALSGAAHDEVRERAERAGFDRHLTKPADLERLRECLAIAQCRRDARGRARPTS